MPPYKHCKLYASKTEFLLPPLSSQMKPASPFTFTLVWVGDSTIQKFTSHNRLLPSLSPRVIQPSSLASFSSSILLPSPPFVLVLLLRIFKQPSDCFSYLQVYTPHRVMYLKCKSDPDTSLLGFSPQSQYFSSSHQDLSPPVTSPYLSLLSKSHSCSNKMLLLL